MRKIRYILSISTFLVLLAVAAVLTGCGGYEKDAYYTVMLPSGEGYTVNSESIVRVLPGETAEFDVKIDSGYEFVKSSAGRFSDGKLIVDNVAFSVTVDLKARKTDDIAYMENGTVEVRSIGGGCAVYGQLAEFCFTPYENYVIEELYINGAAYDFDRAPNGSVTVVDEYDEFISMKAVCLGRECVVTVDEPEFGEIITDSESNIVRYGDTLSVECIADAEYRLIYIEIDGNYVYDTYKYEYKVCGDSAITAKFVGDEFNLLLYDLNGAQVAQSAICADYAQAGEFVYLKNGLDMWRYDDYTLESWNTAADGSGERHALGAMIAMPSDDTVMYAQFKKHTPTDDFEFAEYTDHKGETGYAISAYVNDREDITEIVLPDTYRDKKVFAVADGALKGVKNVSSVVTNTNIERIGDLAFANMPNMSEIYLYDSLRELSASALSGTDINKLHINSAGKRIYDRILETNLVDKQMLVKTSKRNKIVTLSGCSLAKGMCSEMFYEDEYFKNYDVIHMGVHARYGLGLLMDLVNDYLNPGDILVLALENYEHLWLTDRGMQLVNSEQPGRLRHFESNYDVYEEFDLAETGFRNDILSVLPDYFATRADDLDNNRSFISSPNRYMMNEHGDYTYYRPNAEEGALGENISTLYPSMTFLSGVPVINEWAQKHMDNGVRVCFIFPPVYRYKAYDDTANVELRTTFQAELKSLLEFPVLGSIDDAAMPYHCFSDWINHPSTEGTKVYTKRFTELLSDAVAQGVI